MGKILGGGGSKSTSSSGYSALPSNLRSAFDPLGEAIGQYTNPNNSGVVDRFTPLAQTADETAAFNAIRQGFTPTAQSLQSDISMLMNPFEQYGIDEINRQAQGDYSILKQNANAAGQLGSNRQMLGANDIEQTRLGTIGKLRQDQYNQALGQVFNNLIPSRQQDAAGLLGIGEFERGLESGTNLAPINALQAGTGMLSPFVSGGTSTQSSGGSGILGGLGNLAMGLGTSGVGGFLGSALTTPSFNATAYMKGLPWSDIRLKENIIEDGVENGHKMYVFSYKGDPRRWRGVMAQDLLETNPEAVKEIGGFYAVDYRAIGVEMEAV